MADDILDLWRVAVSENAHRYPAASLDGKLCPEILGIIVADDADLVTALQSQADQAQTQVTNLVVGISPGVSSPDTPVFLAHGDFPIAVLFIGDKQVFWEGVVCVHLRLVFPR